MRLSHFLAILSLCLAAACGGQSMPEQIPVPVVPVEKNNNMDVTPPSVKLLVVDTTTVPANVAIEFSEAVDFVLELDNQGRFTQNTFRPDIIVNHFTNLQPGTTYMVSVRATDLSNNSALEYITFTTKTLPPPVANVAKFVTNDIRTVIEPLDEGFMQTTYYKLTAPARVYHYYRYSPDADWMLVTFTPYKMSEGHTSVGPYPPNTRVFFRLVAKDDTDVITDTFESLFITPTK